MFHRTRAAAILTTLALIASVQVAPAQTPEIRLARQFSMGYLQLNVMEHHKLIEKHAKALGIPEVKVSWQITGTRSDPELLQHPFKVEEEKSKDERGYYLNPDAYGQPEDRGIDWARNRVLMQRMKDRRGQMEAKDLKEQTRNQ